MLLSLLKYSSNLVFLYYSLDIIV